MRAVIASRWLPSFVTDTKRMLTRLTINDVVLIDRLELDIQPGLSVLTGDLVCFVDADSEDFGQHFACGLLGPLVCVAGVQFVKGFYRRPFKVNGGVP